MNQALLSLVLATSLSSLVLGRVGPDGYDSVLNTSSPTSSYKFHFEEKTWEEASVICQDEGAHLLVIDKVEEANLLYLLREGQETEQFHVGMHTKSRWDHWVTVLGEPISEAVSGNWLSGEPTPDEHCGAIQLPDKHYNNVRCNFAMMPFICEKEPPGKTKSKQPSLPKNAPVGYVSPNISKPTSAYKIHFERKTWEQANAICEEEGGYLAVINSQEEEDFLTQLRRDKESDYSFVKLWDYAFNDNRGRLEFYVGMHCKAGWGHWVTVLGESIDEIVSDKWKQGEPSSVKHCGAFALPNKYYTSVRCNFESMPFFCEKPVDGNTKSTTTASNEPRVPGAYEYMPNDANLRGSYKIHDGRMTWEQANLTCHEEGAHLLVVNSQAEAAHVDELRRLIGASEERRPFDKYQPQPLLYHVGLHCKGHRGHWVDVMGETVSRSDYRLWLDGSPTPYAHCGAIQLPAKRFDSVKCNFGNLRFICEKEPEGSKVTPTPKPPNSSQLATCQPTGFVDQPGLSNPVSSYKVHHERRTWEEANLICQEEGGHLLVIETQAEADMLHLLTKSQEKTQFLVGINCKGRWGEWVTVLGDSVVKSGCYNQWLEGEPTPDEHCGTIQLPDKRYNNVRCNFAKVPFICEKKNVAANATSAFKTQTEPCLPPGYVTFPNVSSSYKLHSETMSWEEANVVCQEEAAHLVVVNSMEELEYLVKLKEEGDGDEYHVGMHSKGRWGHWITVLGGSVEKSGFNTWLQSESPPEWNCGSIDLYLKNFMNVRCNSAFMPFICEKPASTPALTPEPALIGEGAPCTPDTYETIPGQSNTTNASSYKLHRERVPWDVASFACQSEGAHLVVVDSEDEANFVALLFGRVPVSSPPSHRGYDLVHVGITDRGMEGRWKTILGDSLKYTTWRKGEPNNEGGLEHCAGMSRDKLLEDVQCNNMLDVYPFVCEKKN